jgi:hypothetical protein
VKEQSHKDEMSAALRGDFERLRERGVAATLAVRVDEPQGEARTPPDAEPTPVAEPSPPPLELVAASRPAGQAPEAPPDSPAVVDEAASGEPAGFLSRIFGRS